MVGSEVMAILSRGLVKDRIYNGIKLTVGETLFFNCLNVKCPPLSCLLLDTFHMSQINLTVLGIIIHTKYFNVMLLLVVTFIL